MKLILITYKLFKFLIIFLILDICIFLLIPDNLKTSLYNKRSHKLQSYYYHHDQRANATYYDHWGKNKPLIFTNKYGFKESKIGDVTFSKKNILFIGDSLAEGVGLKYEETWVGLIAEQLKKNKITVLNAGLQTYASSIYLAKTYDLIERKKIPITEVFVMISVNDIYDDYYRYKEVDKNFRVRHDDENNIVFIKLINFIKGNTIIYQIIAELSPPLAFIQKIKASFNTIKQSFAKKNENYLRQENNTREIQSIQSILAVSNRNDYKMMYDEKIFAEIGAKSINKSIAYLERLGEFLEKKNIKLNIILPRESIFIIKDPIDKNYQYLLNKLSSLKQKNINFIYLNDYYKNYKDRFDAYRNLFFTNDVHWNKEGNKKIAEELIKKVFKDSY